MTLTTGEVLQERYRIVSMLGAGGMGAVYQAWDGRLNVPVALKEMTAQPGLSSRAVAELRQQFQQEATVVARLRHSHLVDVKDFFELEGNVYLVMGFVEGESLAERIERQGALDETDVLAWAHQLIDALEYCHRRGVIHRDVKPQNVIIQPDGDAMLVDFGLVKLWDPGDPRTKTAMRGVGTAEYAPPEQYDEAAGHTDPRSDIYSLGATLYHALTGQAPPTVTQRIARRRAFQPPRVVKRGITSATEAAVLRAMALTIEDRFPTMRELALALGGGPVRLARAAESARQKTRTMSTGRRAEGAPGGARWWVWALGALALAALVLVVLGGGLAMWASVMGGEPAPTVSLAATSVLTQPPTHRPKSTPVPTLAAAPTSTTAVANTSVPAPTDTAVVPTRTPEATSTRGATDTPVPTPTDTTPVTATRVEASTATPASSGAVPVLVSPAQGGTYQGPLTLQWQGSLRAGQAYQATVRHTESGHVIQSGSLTDQRWTVGLPAEKPGDWRWYVSVIQGGNEMSTSAEGMFWFNPHGGSGDGGGDDGGGDGGGEPTAAPP